MPAKGRDITSQLREAFAREAESVLRCLFYARRADVEGRADIAAALRSIADGEISQAFGHLEFLEESGDPLAGGGDAAGDLAAVIDAEERAVERYGELAAAARGAGQADAADWFDSLVAAEQVHLTVLRRTAAVGD
ncbi:MAG: rubrerythrin [Candidatus Dormibacteraeota bacterium]|uniref:Rubrerythrin n=1 Tax=Candidatus Amunia macphersoniae TaxID=3127014 RepID=A0A934KG24_9BACT|nr:rubrerythrin [Candidatus Dormibacteraeota bacterium]